MRDLGGKCLRGKKWKGLQTRGGLSYDVFYAVTRHKSRKRSFTCDTCEQRQNHHPGKNPSDAEWEECTVVRN